MRKSWIFAPGAIFALMFVAQFSDTAGGDKDTGALQRVQPPVQLGPAIPLGQSDLPAPLGPMPRLDPIGQFLPPVDPWQPAGIGWGIEGLDDKGDPFCETNRPPTTACDPRGPRPFLHAGIDARPAPDRVVHASAAGRVVIARRTTAPVTGLNPGEAGGIVVVEHDRDGDPATMNDHLLTVYGHVDPEVSAGDLVTQGQRIALTSTLHGDHLHFGVRQGPFDPNDRDVMRAYLPPAGTSGCAGCYARPLPAPVFPDLWQDPLQLFGASPFWLAIFGEATDAAGDVIETDDGSLAFGYTWYQPETPGRSMAVRRLDQQGQLVSQRAYYVSARDAIQHVERTQDGGVIALARTFSSTGTSIPMLVKFDATGEPLWARQYGATETTGLPLPVWWEDLAVTADGGFVVTGTARTFVNSVALVARLDAGGNILWAKTYDPYIFHRGCDGKGIAPTADGGFVVLADYQTPFFPDYVVAKELLVFRLDAAGTVLWGRLLGDGSADARAGQIEVLADGGSIVAGYRTLYGPFRPSAMWVVRLNADGAIAWDSLYGSATGNGLLEEAGTRLVLTSDGGAVIAGHRTSFGPEPLFLPDRDLVLMRLDAAGDIVGQRRLDSLGRETTPLGLRVTSDGYLLAAGGETECRLCDLLWETAARFLVAHLDGNLDCPGQCSRSYDLVRQPRVVTDFPLQFRPQGPLTWTSMEVTLTGIDTAGTRHLCGQGAFGAPPVFQSASISVARPGVSCDKTQHVEAFVCTNGVPAQASSPIVLSVGYDVLNLTARVVDGDSTPERSDLAQVTATVSDFFLPMMDDGSLTPVTGFYDTTVPFCDDDPITQMCRCGVQQFPPYSGDLVSGDGIYARVMSLTLPNLDVAKACILEDTPKMTLLNFPPVTPLPVFLRAMDRLGNVTEASTLVTPAAATVSCSGDQCGCCLLTSPNVVECAGLPGMTSLEIPMGICHLF